MRWIALCTISLLAACAPSGPDNASDMPAATGNAAPAIGEWQTLFDGTDLNAFMMTGDANWTIEGEAVGADAGEGGMLVTNERFADFEFDGEFFVSADANSGVFIRCGSPEPVNPQTCYEVNIYDTRPDQTYRTGGIVDVAQPAAILYTGGRWNRYQIAAVGKRLRVTLNGEELVDVEDDRLSEGHIALQYGSGVVKFRNVRIRRL